MRAYTQGGWAHTNKVSSKQTKTKTTVAAAFAALAATTATSTITITAQQHLDLHTGGKKPTKLYYA